MCRKDGSGALTSFPAIHEPHKQLPVRFPHMHSHTLSLTALASDALPALYVFTFRALEKTNLEWIWPKGKSSIK